MGKRKGRKRRESFEEYEGRESRKEKDDGEKKGVSEKMEEGGGKRWARVKKKGDRRRENDEGR